MERLASMAGHFVGKGVIYVFWFWVAISFFDVTCKAEEIKPETELTTTSIIVHWYDSELELQDALDDSSIAGYSECEFRPDFNTSFCELWLVRPVAIIDKYAFDTIGHEFYHALVGDFHQ